MTKCGNVHFSIGENHDKVYCDVVDMNVCHLLFGRPRQYGANARHSGRNVYKLEKDGVKYTLLSTNNQVPSKRRIFLTITRESKAEV